MAVSFDLSNHTALVTGATGGIGASIARTLHGAGANLVISGTRQAALDSCLLYTSPSPRDATLSRMPSSA